MKKPTIKWSGLVKIEDIQLRKTRYGDIYAVLYTNAGSNVIASERHAQLCCLYEPYEMRGHIKAFYGGQYLKLDRLELFQSNSYKHVVA